MRYQLFRKSCSKSSKHLRSILYYYYRVHPGRRISLSWGTLCRWDTADPPFTILSPCWRRKKEYHTKPDSERQMVLRDRKVQNRGVVVKSCCSLGQEGSVTGQTTQKYHRSIEIVMRKHRLSRLPPRSSSQRQWPRRFPGWSVM